MNKKYNISDIESFEVNTDLHTLEFILKSGHTIHLKVDHIEKNITQEEKIDEYPKVGEYRIDLLKYEPILIIFDDKINRYFCENALGEVYWRSVSQLGELATPEQVQNFKKINDFQKGNHIEIAKEKYREGDVVECLKDGHTYVFSEIEGVIGNTLWGKDVGGNSIALYEVMYDAWASVVIESKHPINQTVANDRIKNLEAMVKQLMERLEVAEKSRTNNTILNEAAIDAAEKLLKGE